MAEPYLKTEHKVVIVLLVCLVCTLIYMASEMASKTVPNFESDHGVLDLKKWMAQTDGPVKISGTWQFYWNRLIFPDQFKQLPAPLPDGYLQIPKYWNSFEIDGKHLPGHGFATYRMQIYLPGSPQTVWFRIPDIASAYIIYANGTVIAKTGTVATSAEQMMPGKSIAYASVTPSDQMIDLVLQISNFQFQDGGTWREIMIGSKQQIKSMELKSTCLDAFIFGCILIISLHHFALYIIRKNEISSLLFAVFCLLMAIRTALSGENIGWTFFGSHSYGILMKLHYLTFYLGEPVFMTFIAVLFYNEFSKTVIRCIQVVGGVFSAVVIICPVQVYSLTTSLFQIWTIITCVYAIYVLLLASYRKVKGAVIMLAGCLILFATVTNDIMMYAGIIHMPQLVPFGVLIFIGAQALMLSLRFSYAVDMIQDQKAELLVAKTQAETANKVKTLFLSNISHELKTPMTGIMGMSNLLLETELKDTQREYSQTIQTSANLLLRLIEDLLDFSKLERGQLTLKEMSFDLRVMLIENLKELNAKANQKQLEFNCIVQHDIPFYLFGDPARIKQVLNHIIGNAIKFTQEGQVTVKISQIEKRQNEKIILHFEIKDTGIGIHADDSKNVFESFSQVDSSDARNYEGAGLGLPMAKKLVEIMNGQIGFDSKPGVGSTFWFTIEVGPGEAFEHKTDRLIDDIEHKNILIVDKYEASRTVLKENLELLGCRYAEADNEILALAQLRKSIQKNRHFDAIIADTNISRESMEFFASKLEIEFGEINLPVIVLTSVGRKGDLQWVKQMKFCAYLTRPIQYLDLADCLKTVLNKQFDRQKVVTSYVLKEKNIGHLKILMAEDNLVNQKLILSFLKKLGYSAQAVVNGKLAVDTMEKEDFDLILMDIRMPVMDGIEATKIIRDPNSKVKRHDVIIIAVTAHASQEDCLKAGMDGYLSKPVKKEDIRNVIESCLSSREDRQFQYF